MENRSNAQHLKSAWQTLCAGRQAGAHGSLFVFTAPRARSGTSYVVREMALLAAQQLPQGKPVLIVDMDIRENAVSHWFFDPQSVQKYGQPAGPYDASFGMAPFWRVTPAMVDAQGQNLTDSHFMSLHMVAGSRLAFTNFLWDKIKPGQTVQIAAAHQYWYQLRQQFAAIFVDTPALERSDLLSTISPEADGTVLVCAPEQSKSKALGDAYINIKALGAHCSGVIYNRVPTPASHWGAV